MGKQAQQIQAYNLQARQVDLDDTKTFYIYFTFSNSLL